MDPQTCVGQLQAAKEYFDRSAKCLVEDDSTFAPTEGSMSTAQHVAHVAQTVDWFMEGAFRPEGFDMDFESMAKEIMAVSSLSAAREWLDKAFASASEITGAKSAEELAAPLPEGPIMGGLPRFVIYGAIQDHTAHHRGALTVHSRLRGYTPAMPYMEEMEA